MPSTSAKQRNFMAAVAHNPAFAKKAGVSQSVGKDFNQADKGRKFSKGGDMKKMNMGGYADGGMTKSGMKHEDVKMDKKMMQKAVNKHEGRLHKGESMTKLSKGGMAPSKMGSVKSSSSRDGIATKGKTKGTMIKMTKGGMAC
jgi:hypothetical protein